MLSIKAFTFNPFQENTYLLINENKQCWIIDPGMYGNDEEQQMFKFIDDNNLKPQQIINTHTHLDHIFGIDALKQKYNIPFGMHRDDLPVLQNAGGSAMMFGFQFGAAPTPDFFIETGKLQLGNDEVEVRLAPGHSPGSICFYSEPDALVIAGDVLFQRSIGRTDLPGGDHDTLIESIRKQLFTLPAETLVLSGHGSPTTIGEEQEFNPFLVQ